MFFLPLDLLFWKFHFDICSSDLTWLRDRWKVNSGKWKGNGGVFWEFSHDILLLVCIFFGRVGFSFGWMGKLDWVRNRETRRTIVLWNVYVFLLILLEIFRLFNARKKEFQMLKSRRLVNFCTGQLYPIHPCRLYEYMCVNLVQKKIEGDIYDSSLRPYFFGSVFGWVDGVPLFTNSSWHFSFVEEAPRE